MTISASMVKDLRQKTGAGFVDCKNALRENNGDMAAAFDWLRAKGIAKAEKKSGRIAAEGLIGIASSDTHAAIVEVNSETDFVARNEQFQSLVKAIANTGLETRASIEDIIAHTIAGGIKSVHESLQDSIAAIGENINFRRSAVLSVDKGIIATYVHNSAGDGIGKIGVLVALESEGKKTALKTIGKQIAMHIAATNPIAKTSDEIPADVVKRERDFFVEQIRESQESSKPANIIEKIVDGRMRKFFEEVALMSQTFVIDNDKTVEQAIKNAEKDAGSSITLKSFVRFALGDGIEKSENDFATEVAAMNK